MLNNEAVQLTSGWETSVLDSQKNLSNPSAKAWKGKLFPMYERLATIFEKDQATGHGAQTPINMVNDLNLDSGNEQFNDVYSPMSMNEIHNEPSTRPKLRGKRESELKDDDIVSGFDNVAKKLFDKLAAKLDKSEANYPQYLTMELDRLGFSADNNLEISKAMRLDPSNVEVFKIIGTDAGKIEFVRKFLNY
ncbi:uncharacterized protein LOC112490554 isoform X2 [Ziziphus jujuba]|uniref:Uncharacterized protein LOC112490554 isoform X2 n=1 Tax=Ziziphus jujuba TaxID=326968 RepID=A0ABM3INI4_ZIZJJ|nr:uncharacterized protein LOC112490554 isoform X2 [Ziziphus jujuba]